MVLPCPSWYLWSVNSYWHWPIKKALNWAHWCGWHSNGLGVIIYHFNCIWKLNFVPKIDFWWEKLINDPSSPFGFVQCLVLAYQKGFKLRSVGFKDTWVDLRDHSSFPSKYKSLISELKFLLDYTPSQLLGLVQSVHCCSNAHQMLKFKPVFYKICIHFVQQNL